MVMALALSSRRRAHRRFSVKPESLPATWAFSRTDPARRTKTVDFGVSGEGHSIRCQHIGLTVYINLLLKGRSLFWRATGAALHGIGLPAHREAVQTHHGPSRSLGPGSNPQPLYDRRPEGGVVTSTQPPFRNFQLAAGHTRFCLQYRVTTKSRKITRSEREE